MIHGGQITNKTDIWPLGLTFWEMMALMPPHSLDETLDESVEQTWDEDMFRDKYGISFYFL